MSYVFITIIFVVCVVASCRFGMLMMAFKLASDPDELKLKMKADGIKKTLSELTRSRQ